MKNLLFVVDENRRGGVSVALQNLILMLQNEDCIIDVLVLHDQNEMLKELPKNINIMYGTSFFNVIDYSLVQVLKSHNLCRIAKKIYIILGMKLGYIVWNIKHERRKILQKKYDIEIAFKDGFPAIFTACGDANKKIHWIHSEYKEQNSNSKYEKLFKTLLPKFNVIIAVSKGISDQFNNIYGLDKKTYVIPNIIPVSEIKGKALEQDITYESEIVNVVLVGRCHSDKGYLRFLNCLNELVLKGKVRDIRFHIIGDGPETEKIKQFIETNKLNSWVELYGAKENPYCYMKNADCLFLPSINESFGLVAVEAMSLGVPVIMTNTAAAETIVEDGITGRIVDNSIDGVIKAIEELQNKNKLSQYKKNLVNYTYDNKTIYNNIKSILGV